MKHRLLEAKEVVLQNIVIDGENTSLYKKMSKKPLPNAALPRKIAKTVFLSRKRVKSLEFDATAFEDLAWWIEQDRDKALKIIQITSK